MNIQEDALRTAIELLRENPKTAKALGINIELVTDEVLPENRARVASELEKIAPIAKAIGEVGVDKFKNFSTDRQLETVNIVGLQQNLIAGQEQTRKKIIPTDKKGAYRKGVVYHTDDHAPDDYLRDFRGGKTFVR